MGIKEDINELADRLRRERDQLSVKIHLANMEVRDEWQDLEEKRFERQTLSARNAPGSLSIQFLRLNSAKLNRLPGARAVTHTSQLPLRATQTGYSVG